ncbi:hypothetical protein BLA39750_01076 [Burkholderia lata]|uniref:Uncharacterized protein n=1 Tax=Burkholderia lata (strain ATCC 17760 / DSM 23089 / LMG 22485 / NCIMB 9086 / R18194 / 383) TaxID=482957 RepID=A0A6P2V9F1_BURL3|nr:hypothetical protein BLA39750_01076 [Burkholderia lata]
MSPSTITPEFDQRSSSVRAAPDTSDWLKGALGTLSCKDPVDAVNDAELLLELMNLRMHEVLTHARAEANRRA